MVRRLAASLLDEFERARTFTPNIWEKSGDLFATFSAPARPPPLVPRPSPAGFLPRARGHFYF